MNINLEALEQIPQLLQMVVDLKNTLEAGTIEKRWLNKQEMIAYSGYSDEALKTKRKTNDLVENIHYYKHSATSIIYDKIEIDKWQQNIRPTNNNDYKHSLSDTENEILELIA